MNDEIARIKNRIKNKRSTNLDESVQESKKIVYCKNLLSRVLITIILVLISIIYINKSDQNLLQYKELIFTKNLSFAKLNTWYQEKFGEIIPIDLETSNAEMVFDEDIAYSAIDKYQSGHKLTVFENAIINNITSGIVVYIGEKDDYGNTVIVQGIDGADVWYGNITNTNLTLYDYVEQGSIIGESKNDYIYIVISKDGEYIDYEEYINQNKN